MCGPRPPHSCAVAAGPVFAPALRARLCGIVKNPAAILVGADSYALRVLSRHRFRQGSGDLCKRPVGIPLHGNQLRSPPILALDDTLPRRYVENVIQPGNSPGFQRVSRSQLWCSATQQLAQIHQRKARRFTTQNGRELPMFLEGSQPLRVIQVVRAPAKSVPLLAVCEINPGSNLAESMRVKDVLWCFQGNDLNLVDSLQWTGYPYVMSIAAIKHYGNRGFFQASVSHAAAHG